MSAQLFFRDGRAFNGKPLLSEKSGAPYTMHQERCSRCGGAGGADKWAHTGWTCFDCQGSGKGHVVVDKLYTAEKLTKLNAAKEKSDARKAAKRAVLAAERAAQADRERAAFLADIAPLFELTKHTTAKDQAFISDVVATATSKAFISERQIEVIESAWVRFQLELERAAACAVSRHVGEVGKRIEVNGKVRKVFTMDVASFRGYGTDRLYIVTIDGDDGACYVYKGNAGWKFGEKGEAVSVVATVKEHNEYRDEKQTLITRPKFKNEEAMS